MLLFHRRDEVINGLTRVWFQTNRVVISEQTCADMCGHVRGDCGRLL